MVGSYEYQVGITPTLSGNVTEQGEETKQNGMTE